MEAGELVLECPDHAVDHELELLLRHIEDSLELVLDGGLEELEEVDSVVGVAVEILRDEPDGGLEYGLQDLGDEIGHGHVELLDDALG